MTAHLPPPLSPGTTPDPAAPAPGAAVPLARLSLSPLGTAPHRLDGAWWPRSHDLGRELPSLLAALEQRWPHISRITVSRSLWRTGTDRLLLGERVLRINRSDAAHSMICLVSYGIGRCDLLVIPPGTSVHEGRRLLAAASAVDAEVLRAAGDAVLDPEQVDLEDVDPEQVEPEHVEPKQIEPEHAEPRQIEPGRPEPKQIGPENVGPEHVGPERDPGRPEGGGAP